VDPVFGDNAEVATDQSIKARMAVLAVNSASQLMAIGLPIAATRMVEDHKLGRARTDIARLPSVSGMLNRSMRKYAGVEVPSSPVL
jgi:hypothetical protein